MGQLVLVRHGQSVWNLENKFTGWVDVELSSQGVSEAEKAGDLLKTQSFRFQAIHTSRLKRAQKTLEIIMKKLNLQGEDVQIDSALNERHYGDLQGLNKDELRKKYGDEQVHIWRRSYDVAPPNGECLKDCAKRTLPYYKEYILPQVKAGKDVLVVAHGNSLRSIIMEIEKMSPDEILNLNLDTGVPIVYGIDSSGKMTSKKILSQ